MEEQTERWDLRSGIWHRDSESESWHLVATPDGTCVHEGLSEGDVALMVRANRDSSTGRWFPSDFKYSPLTGTSLQVATAPLDSPWIPPFGASALSDVAGPLAKGLRQTPAALNLDRSTGPLDPANDADRTLPALPPGDYRFLVHMFDVASPTLMAIDPEGGKLFVLLPESKVWMPLGHAAGGSLAGGLKNWRGWRMEVMKGRSCATLYLPTASGLAVVKPTLIDLSYAAEYFGSGPALGSPVAWAGAVWLPVQGAFGLVDLIGKPPGARQPIVLRTAAIAPQDGFEAPVFDARRVIWPSEEGQFVFHLDQDGKKRADWIAWPDGLKPAFALGCPYVSRSGFFWQPCSSGSNEALQYVEMGEAVPEKIAVDTPRLGTGYVSYKEDQRIVDDPWKQPQQVVNDASSEVVVPLIESKIGHAVIGLRIDAPQGVVALLESIEPHRAVLQLQADGRADLRFGTLTVARPWLTSVFVHDAHLWVYHPELPQALGWRLSY